jgi:hypothetical protein
MNPVESFIILKYSIIIVVEPIGGGFGSAKSSALWNLPEKMMLDKGVAGVPV